MVKEGEAEVGQVIEREFKMRGDIILLPQPSDDSEDPLVSSVPMFFNACHSTWNMFG